MDSKKISIDEIKACINSDEYRKLVSEGHGCIAAIRAKCCQKVVLVFSEVGNRTLNIRGMHCNQNKNSVFECCVNCDTNFGPGEPCQLCGSTERKQVPITDEKPEYDTQTDEFVVLFKEGIIFGNLAAANRQTKPAIVCSKVVFTDDNFLLTKPLTFSDVQSSVELPPAIRAVLTGTSSKTSDTPSAGSKKKLKTTTDTDKLVAEAYKESVSGFAKFEKNIKDMKKNKTFYEYKKPIYDDPFSNGTY